MDCELGVTEHTYSHFFLFTMSGLPPLGGTGKSKSMSGRSNMSETEDNPFKLPSDDQIFRLREDDKKKKSMNADSGAHVWEKGISKLTSRTERLRDLVGEDKLMTLNEAIKVENDAAKMLMPRRQEKENTAEFVAKKREMFLVQMSLDTKREEIRKLEEKARMKEEALQRSEQMLEEDAMRFDAFLKENDKKAHDAIKKAEEETKKKQEKTQEIKRLTQQIQALSSEMSKHREALDDCMRYKKFLDMLTPPEWFEQHRQQREDKVKAVNKENWEAKMKAWEKQRRRIIEQHRKDVEAKREAQKKERNKRSSRNKEGEDEADDDEPEQKPNIPPQPRLEDERFELPDEEVPMYFTEPQQLMDIFSALEEQNLFLIQNSQETEHTLEELQHAFADTRLTMEQHTSGLQTQIADLQGQISSEDARAKLLLNKRLAGGVESAGGGNGRDAKVAVKDDPLGGVQNQLEKERLLSELNTKVRHAYEQCGFDASTKPSTLVMLSQVIFIFLYCDILYLPAYSVLCLHAFLSAVYRNLFVINSQ